MADPKDHATEDHPGMLGDGTEEQNLNQPGDPSKRITEDEVNGAFDSPDEPEDEDED